MAESIGLGLVNHETGDLTQYSSAEVGSGNSVAVIAGAARHGSYGRRDTYGGTSGLSREYKSLASPVTELYGRFYFYIPSSYSGATGYPYIFTFWDGTTAIANCRCYWNGTAWALNRLYYATDGGTIYEAVSGVSISMDAEHYIEMRYKKATAAGANDGIAQLWFDGTSAASVTNADSDTIAEIDSVSLGQNATAIPSLNAYIDYDDLKLSDSAIGAYADVASGKPWYYYANE